MQYLPIAWHLANKPALLAGGGEVALRKARLLHRAGAHIRLVAPRLSEDLAALVGEGGGEILREPFDPVHLEGIELAVAATDDREANRRLAEEARSRGVPVNVVDDPELSNFIFPALVDRDPVLVSITSSGASPVLARWVRARIEQWLPSRWGRVAGLLERYRLQVRERLPSVAARRLFWERTLDSPIVEKVLAGKEREADEMLRAAVQSADTERLEQGEVYLVGAGPGDPDLMTFRALRLLQKADVVLHDRLIPKDILDFARRDAELLYVGKKNREHVVGQDEINRLLVDYARKGYKVCRLKGGDPFIFGRGGEEIDSVVEAGIPFQVVPGVTAASGCASYAGIPLTHRDHAQSVRFITGHRREDGELDLPWDRLVVPRETLVFYMGLRSLPDICARLREHGMSADMPAALISRGTTDAQEVIVGTLETLPEEVERHQPGPPALVIVGTVVHLRNQYQWFGSSH